MTTAFLMTLLCAAPAAAKMVSLQQVEITGPGIDGTLVVSPDEFGRIKNENSPAAVALDGVYSPFDKEPRPEGSLGPRYVITYVQEFVINERELVRLDAHLYPYAEAGPVTFILPDQRKEPRDLVVPERLTRAGWLPYPEALVENLRAAGLPSPEAAERASRVDPSTAWPWALAGIALASVLWGVGSLGDGRRATLARI